MTPTALRLIFLKMFMKLRKQIKTAANCQIADNLQESFSCLHCLRKKERKERKEGSPEPPKGKSRKEKKKIKKKKFIVNYSLLT